jgi:hypothetical protein
MQLYLYSPVCHRGLHRDSLSLALLWHFQFLLVRYSSRTHARTHTHISPHIILCIYKQTKAYVLLDSKAYSSLLSTLQVPSQNVFPYAFLSYTCIMSYEWLKRKIRFYIRDFRIPSSKRPLTCRQKTVPFDKLLHSPSVYSRDAQHASTNSTVLVHDCQCTQDIVQYLPL